MKSLYLLTITFLLSTTTLFSQKKVTLSNAINIAGKQRMLGQRMAKNLLYIKYSKKDDEAKIELEKTISQFNKGLRILKDFAPTKEIRFKIDLEELTYNTYLKQINTKSKKSIAEVVSTNTIFLKLCDDVVQSLIDYSKTIENTSDKDEQYIIKKIAEATDSSGKLRYLTQRLTLYYAINNFKLKNVRASEIEEIMNTIVSNLNKLTLLEFNTLEIDDALSEVYLYLNNLKTQLYIDGNVDMNSKNLTVDEMNDICNIILGKANTATKMYADLLKS